MLTFHTEAHRIDVRGALFLSARPDRFADGLLYMAKRYATYAKLALEGVTHTQALEATSRAAGFKSWFDLQATAKRLHAEDPQLSGGRLDSFAHALVLLCAIDEEGLAPTEKQVLGITDFCEKLAAELATTKEVALGIAAKVNVAESWGELLAQTPLRSKKPLYRFSQGRFEVSAACRRLIEMQDERFQH